MARCILKYVKSTLQYGLFYETRVQIQLHGYTNVDWADSISYKRSTSGYVFSFGSATVTWSSKKQPNIEHDTAKVKDVLNNEEEEESTEIGRAHV